MSVHFLLEICRNKESIMTEKPLDIGDCMASGINIYSKLLISRIRIIDIRN